MAGLAFDLAEHFQTPVFVMSDLDLGMNNWMADRFKYPQKPLNRGKVLRRKELERVKEFARYKDVDGDGVPYRTLPGTAHPLAAYFTRGSGHNENAAYTEDPEEYSVVVARLARKFETARAHLPAPVIEGPEAARVGIIAYGTSHWPIVESRDILRAEHDLPTKYLRLRGYPFSEKIGEFIDDCDRVYVVDQNRDGQMHKLLRMELSAQQIDKLRSLTIFDGLPPSTDNLVKMLLEQENRS